MTDRPEDLPIDDLSPEDEAFLQSFLSQAKTEPPEGYESQLLDALDKKLVTKTGVFPRFASLIKGNRQLLSAAAVMIIAIVVPLKVLDNPFMEQTMAPQRFENMDNSAALQPGFTDPNKPSQSMVLGAGRTDEKQQKAKAKNEGGFIAEEREDNRLRKNKERSVLKSKVMASTPKTESKVSDKELDEVKPLADLSRVRRPAPRRAYRQSARKDPSPQGLGTRRGSVIIDGKVIQGGEKRINAPKATQNILRDRLGTDADISTPDTAGKKDLNKKQLALAPSIKKNKGFKPIDQLARKEMPMESKIVAPPPTSPTSTRHYNVKNYLVRRGSMRLEVPELQTGFSKIAKIVESHEGYIVESKFRKTEKGQATASFQLKVPTASLMRVIEEMESKGVVREKEIKSEDIWLKLQKERLKTERINDKIDVAKKKNKNKVTPLSLKYQLQEQELKNQQHKQMLTYATLYVTLFEKTNPWGSFVSDNTWRKLYRMVRNTADMLTDLIVFLPPVLLFLGCAWVVWKLLAWALVTRLALMPLQVLGWTYVSALVFFPVYFSGQELLGGVVLFASLIGFVWGLKTFMTWFKAKQDKPETDSVEGL